MKEYISNLLSPYKGLQKETSDYSFGEVFIYDGFTGDLID